jgi:ERCC4-type nuclease
MELIIDDRERSNFYKCVVDRAAKFNVPIKNQRIEVGDYVIGKVCFEVKSSTDFLASVINKRIWTQLDNMDRCFEKNFLVIHGTVDEAMDYMDYTNDRTPRKAKIQILTNKFHGAIGRIRLDYDTNIIWTSKCKDAANQLVTLAKMAPVERSVITPSIPRRISTGDLRVDMLSLVKGVSAKKAKQLLKEFGSIMEIGEHDINSISKMEGFGSIVAKRLITVLNAEQEVKQ